MTKLLCASDIHDDESKHSELEEMARGCDGVITAGDDWDRMHPTEDPRRHEYESNIILGELLQRHQQSIRISDSTITKFKALLREVETLPKSAQQSQIDGFLQQHPEIVHESQRIQQGILEDFALFYKDRGAAVNSKYERIGLPVVGVLGNHDPAHVVEEMTAVTYLNGDTTDLAGFTVGGLPATGEWVSGPLKFCSALYPHLHEYRSTKIDPNATPSDTAQALLDGPALDIFVTHKAYKENVQNLDEHYARQDSFGIDMGAAAVSEKHKPIVSIFGHYHRDRPFIAKHSGRFHVYVGPAATVVVEFGAQKKPTAFTSQYYNAAA